MQSNAPKMSCRDTTGGGLISTSNQRYVASDIPAGWTFVDGYDVPYLRLTNGAVEFRQARHGTFYSDRDLAHDRHFQNVRIPNDDTRIVLVRLKETPQQIRSRDDAELERNISEELTKSVADAQRQGT